MNELDLVISFDDTGSMSSVRKLVRNHIKNFIDEIYKHIPTARIGIIIHNDYCDPDYIQFLQLSSDKEELKRFVNKDTSCGGGDADECYELAINYFHSKVSWKSDKKIAILIGDCNPHNKGYKGYYRNCEHDWKEELDKCATNGIIVYPIQCLNNSSANTFYNTVAQKTNGIKLELLQFQYILTYILGIFHKENNTLETYENSQTEFKSNFSLKSMFDKLFKRTPTPAFASVDKNNIWKFQVMDVPTDIAIKEFVEGNGIHFKKGKGYYQLTKTEEIQEYKEILMVNKETDETISDTDECRRLLGIGRERCNFNPRTNPVTKKFDTYIQSTSVNRKLKGGTKFLYELDYK